MVEHFSKTDLEIGMLIGVFLLGGLVAAGGFYYIQVAGTAPLVGGEEPDHVIDMVADDWYFEPAEITVQEGDRVRLVIESDHSETGVYDHGIAIPEFGVNEDLPAGETTEVEFVADRTGEFQFYCSIYCGEDHHHMTGTLIVEEADNSAATEASAATTDARADVDEISRHPSDLPDHPDYTLYANGTYEQPVEREAGENLDITVHSTFKEIDAEVVPGTSLEFWTFDGTVPGPMIRARQGDTISWNLFNPPNNTHPHNIAVHGVQGPGGGGIYTDVAPGGKSVLDTTMLEPGVYIYHCAYPEVAEHIGYGMYGIIVVEPEDGLEEVDHEFQIVQGELYTGEGGDQSVSALEDRGHLSFSRSHMYDENPSMVVFNGRPDAVTGDRALGNYDKEIHVNDTVRVFYGNAGLNHISSYRPFVGEQVDHYGGGFTLIEESEETVAVPAGAAKMFETTFRVPGSYPMYDHSAGRTSKGAVGETRVSGDIEAYHHIFNPRQYDELR